MAIIPPSPYNFYHEDIAPAIAALAHKKGIVGYTGDHKVTAGTPLGKPIYKGADKNTHLTPNEHRQAVETLTNRANRIKEHLRYKNVASHELPVIHQELNDTTSQIEAHKQMSMAPQTNAVASPIKKSEGTTSPLSKLLSILRGKKTFGM